MENNSTTFPILEIKGLTKVYAHKEALSDVNLTLQRGRIVGLLGPNGSGKTTMIKTIAGLLTPTGGDVFINGLRPGPGSKAIVSYLPDKTYLNDWMKVSDLITFFADFYSDFDAKKAYDMLERLHIDSKQQLKTLSKGTKEKVQLILVMSRNAQLYLLDEPIGGVDPAARDYILNTIVTNYSPESTVIISTHLINDVEKVLDDVIFLSNGRIALVSSVDDIREQKQKSVDELFREVYKC
ncbi:MAG: ABC transporter ATP-binding protein [Angelakisella sp.]